MQFISTRGQSPIANFQDVLLGGLAPDGGLYVPVAWPVVELPSTNLSYADIAFQIIAPYINGCLSTDKLKKIIAESYSPDIFLSPSVVPLHELSNKLNVLELFHGPTLAFKDVALQFLGRLFDVVLEDIGQSVTIIGATSGDTGSAAIEAFKGRKNISLTILHPHGRTSDIQRRQMTSVIADNIHNIAVHGTFDDCQNLVKQCFNDKELRQRKNLSAINSINWARIIAQTVYYATTAHALKTQTNFAVPTGNFGNVLAAFVAKKMGVPVGQLVIGSNRNDILTRFFETGAMTLDKVTPSFSPSMDIQISSNFERILFELTGRDADKIRYWMNQFKEAGAFKVSSDELEKIRTEFLAYRCSDEETTECIKRIYQTYNYIIDPHTAVGMLALEKSGLLDSETISIALACAHPAKFPDVVKGATGITPELPEQLSDLMSRPEKYKVMDNDYSKIRQHVLNV
jgi:threonine synthase